VNLYGEQLVEPQPNPYFAHWPQNLGQLGATGGSLGGTLFFVGALALLGVGAYCLGRMDG
jgi:hypothetical protein